MLNHVGLGDGVDNLWEGLQGKCNSTGGGGRQISAPVIAKKWPMACFLASQRACKLLASIKPFLYCTSLSCQRRFSTLEDFDVVPYWSSVDPSREMRRIQESTQGLGPSRGSGVRVLYIPGDQRVSHMNIRT